MPWIVLLKLESPSATCVFKACADGWGVQVKCASHGALG